ncbi:PREDICTED: uncharacterized protein LOC104809667 [Tarenaya hassleriana]|uniref:uncharacterized protein LOC104809667 n=1 Tax=Tarenaya hassleriana TaxID=28532 RepID=UPI0008FCEBC8|nr:PREDICTED: uncharacterized protein LOC104809667 [Tarenaya hassleriana]
MASTSVVHSSLSASSNETDSRIQIAELNEHMVHKTIGHMVPRQLVTGQRRIGHMLSFMYKMEDIQFSPKINTKCYPSETIKKLKDLLSPEEWRYFSHESQFQHLFHMQFDGTLKMAPAAFLINHCVNVKDEKELWFVLNGVPIRYSIVEHALISGLKCGEYPAGWEYMRKSQFRVKTFGNRKVSKESVIRHLEKTPTQRAADRKKLAVIMLLGGILDHGTTDEFINHDLVDMVDDLAFCERFPWDATHLIE